MFESKYGDSVDDALQFIQHQIDHQKIMSAKQEMLDRFEEFKVLFFVNEKRYQLCIFEKEIAVEKLDDRSFSFSISWDIFNAFLLRIATSPNEPLSPLRLISIVMPLLDDLHLPMLLVLSVANAQMSSLRELFERDVMQVLACDSVDEVRARFAREEISADTLNTYLDKRSRCMWMLSKIGYTTFTDVYFDGDAYYLTVASTS